VKRALCAALFLLAGCAARQPVSPVPTIPLVAWHVQLDARECSLTRRRVVVPWSLREEPSITVSETECSREMPDDGKPEAIVFFHGCCNKPDAVWRRLPTIAAAMMMTLGKRSSEQPTLLSVGWGSAGSMFRYRFDERVVGDTRTIARVRALLVDLARTHDVDIICQSIGCRLVTYVLDSTDKSLRIRHAAMLGADVAAEELVERMPTILSRADDVWVYGHAGDATLAITMKRHLGRPRVGQLPRAVRALASDRVHVVDVSDVHIDDDSMRHSYYRGSESVIRHLAQVLFAEPPLVTRLPP
jgi:esterase/lipase superfamily enzyme